MNNFLATLLSIYFIFFSFYVIPLKEVETAFSKGDANKIVQLGASKMLITINGNEGVYSKSQGKQVLENFFKNNPPKSFEVKYQSNNNSENSFAIGNYSSTNGINYQVSLKFKKIEEKNLIISLTIAKKE